VDRPNNRLTLARRYFVTGLAGVSLAPLARLSQARTGPGPSPSQTLGPFYPRDGSERPRETDADLLTLDGDHVVTKGTPLFLIGRVVDGSDHAVAGAAVEVWQCDANAVYHHPAGGAETERDAAFQGYGAAATDANGEFRFRTIVPVAYPGRTPHIHIRVAPSRGRAFATQLYLPGDAGNPRDFLFSRLSPEEQQALTLVIEPTRNQTHPLARATRLTGRTELVIA
jgi:protocatechuate 3,4-dioxygenase beta subunit